jgi:prepilin-type N-terminal cleavage/methylation domain-containing protein
VGDGAGSRGAARGDRTRPPRAWCLGFSLLELTVVLAIVAIASALAFPAVSAGVRNWQLQAAARELSVSFKFARNQAVARREPLQVVLERTRGVYWVDHVGKGAAANFDEAERKGIRLYALPTGVRFGEITVEGYPASGDQIGLVFAPRGTSEEATVQVVGERGRRYQIAIDPVTGYARVGR